MIIGLFFILIPLIIIIGSIINFNSADLPTKKMAGLKFLPELLFLE